MAAQRRIEHAQAARELAASAPEFQPLLARCGPPELPSRATTAFESIARSIVHQQLAGAAATSIWKRVRAGVGGPVCAWRLNQSSDECLRGCGLSASKLAALRDLARLAPELRLSGLHRLSDEAVVERLVLVRGVGEWTAHMFLMFHLRRLDVWPNADLGVREGYRRLHGLGQRPTAKELVALGEAYAPYRSVAAWYLWRACEVLPAAAAGG